MKAWQKGAVYGLISPGIVALFQGTKGIWLGFPYLLSGLLVNLFLGPAKSFVLFPLYMGLFLIGSILIGALIGYVIGRWKEK